MVAADGVAALAGRAKEINVAAANAVAAEHEKQRKGFIGVTCAAEQAGAFKTATNLAKMSASDGR